MAELGQETRPAKISRDDVIFSEASSEQLTTVWTLNAEAWAEPFSVAEHVERERILSQQPASGELWKTWVLTLSSDRTIIVASVETFEKPVFIGEAGVRIMEKGYGIASVFTNPQYRGNRMADLLLEKLKEWLDGNGRGWISVLYSDIGAHFYDRLGWSPGSTRTLYLEGDSQALDNEQDRETQLLTGVKPLEFDDLRSLCEQDCIALQSDLKNLSEDGQTYYAFAPRFETLAWHLKRGDLNASLLHGRSDKRHRGAISASGRAWIVWHFDETGKKLKVQRLVVLDKNEHKRNVEEVASLIRYAQHVAQKSDFLTTLIWNPNDVTIAAVELLKPVCPQIKVTIKDREGSIASARRKNGDAQGNLVWHANEYYAWC